MNMMFVKILEQVINDAIKHNASDIHLTHDGIYFRVKKQVLLYDLTEIAYPIWNDRKARCLKRIEELETFDIKSYTDEELLCYRAITGIPFSRHKTPQEQKHVLKNALECSKIDLENLQDEKKNIAKIKLELISKLFEEIRDYKDDRKDLENEQSVSIYIGEVRCRISKFTTINGASYAIRIYNNQMPTLDSIQAPLALAKICENTSGLILVCGTTGAGKSTTLAAMINHINTTTKKHILTLEDPIEYIHKSNKSLVNQREIGLHSKSFESSLIASLREDPDVILIGEILSPEVLTLAITHALSGHLVLASFHANNCMDAITRMIGMKQSDCNIRANLATCLQGIITQKLYDNGERLTADFEILIANPAVSALIKDDKIWQLDSQISMGKSVGMQHFSKI